MPWKPVTRYEAGKNSARVCAQFGSSADGTVAPNEGHPTVTCPWHEATFDLNTGATLQGPIRTPVHTYAVRVGDDGYIYVAEQSEVTMAEGAD